MDRKIYSKVDALEEVTNFWGYGKSMFTIPTYNVYVPTRYHTINRPNLLDDSNDDTSYRYNLNRLSPYSYLNTMKGYKMNPQPGERVRPKNMGKPKVGGKNRRLSHARGYVKPVAMKFSTTI